METYKNPIPKHPEKKQAVALVYPEGFAAPLVIASGSGHVAERIERLSREASVPIIRNTELTSKLIQVEIGEYIPVETYRIVADLLVFVGKISKQREVHERS